MNIGDTVTVPDGRAGTLIRLENNVATILFVVIGQPIAVAFNESDVQPTSER